MMPRSLKALCSILVITLCSATCTLDFASFSQRRVTFPSSENELFGTLIVPINKPGPFPTVIFVHGDGPLPYDAYGYYRPIWEALAEQGIAAFSWDKPGVKASTGNWLQQSMDQRAEEVVNAIEQLKKYPDIVDSNKIGVMGFSQAGWVLPLLPKKKAPIKFMVLVSTAVNWLEQGKYYRKIRLAEQHPDLINAEIMAIDEPFYNELLRNDASYEEYVKEFYNRKSNSKKTKLDQDLDILSEDRYQFVSENWRSDATPYLKDISIPVLAVFGENDLNIDINHSILIYKEELSKTNSDFSIKVYSNSSHSLTKASIYNKQNPGVILAMYIAIFGKHIFAENSLQEISHWIKSTSMK